MRLSAEVSDGFLAVPYGKGCILLLTPRGIEAGIRRGKWWRTKQAAAKREADAVTLNTPRAPEYRAAPGCVCIETCEGGEQTS